MPMKAAHLATSPRLQRVADLLADGQEHTTMEIVQAAQVCAVNSIVAELRANGLEILCRRCGDVWVYWQPHRAAERAKMNIDEIKKQLSEMSEKQEMINGHRVVRLYSDRWRVDGPYNEFTEQHAVGIEEAAAQCGKLYNAKAQGR